jgi:hypothetical protein
LFEAGPTSWAGSRNLSLTGFAAPGTMRGPGAPRHRPLPPSILSNRASRFDRPSPLTTASAQSDGRSYRFENCRPVSCLTILAVFEPPSSAEVQACRTEHTPRRFLGERLTRSTSRPSPAWTPPNAIVTLQVNRDSATRAPCSQGRQRTVPLRSAGRTGYRGREPPQNLPASTRPPLRGSDKPARPTTIFIHNGAPQAQLGWSPITPHAGQWKACHSQWTTCRSRSRLSMRGASTWSTSTIGSDADMAKRPAPRQPFGGLWADRGRDRVAGSN